MATQGIVIAGFGGQGVLAAGVVLAEAVLADGGHVTWLPAYGPEQRGGAANCAIVLSDAPVSSPLVTRPDGAVVMSPEAMARFGAAVRPGGILVYNSTLCQPPSREDLRLVAVPATALARELGDVRAATMAALGALVAALGGPPLFRVEAALPVVLKSAGDGALAVSRRALLAGAGLAAV